MGNTSSSPTDITIDLSESRNAPARFLAALESFDKLVEQIDGAVLGCSASRARDLVKAS